MGGRIRFHKNSILFRVLGLMLSTLLVMFFILYGVIFYGGIIEQLRQNSFDILSERVINRKNNLESDLLRRFANLEDPAASVEETVNQVLFENSAGQESLTVASPVTEQALSAVEDKLIYLLRRNSVTGVFVVFNGDQPSAQPGPGEQQTRAGLYIRDYEPESDPSDNSDLMLERAPVTFSPRSHIALDSYWEPNFIFSAEQNRDFYYKPYLAAHSYPDAEREDLGYWAPSFDILDDLRNVITYSVPLYDGEGTPFGVLGIELSEDYLIKKLPFGEIARENKGSFLLGVQEGETDKNSVFTHLVASGLYYQRVFDNDTNSVTLGSSTEGKDCRRVFDDGRVKGTVFGCVKYLSLYNPNTPFEDERWALVGIVEGNELLGLYYNIRSFLSLVLVGTFLLGAVSVVTVSIWFTRPITRLVRQVRESDGTQPVKLSPINIRELDELSSAVENLSSRVADFYSRLSQIMEVAGFRVGAFEYTEKSGTLFYTDGLLDVLGQAGAYQEGGRRMQVDDLMRLFQTLDGSLESSNTSEQIYKIDDPEGTRWVRLTYIANADRYLGVVTDVTAEYVERRKIEYERDYDLLTSLYNRRAFHTAVKQIFEYPEHLQVAAAVMLDLDNLKYINDTYGHDCGDQYICCAAQILKQHSSKQVLAARMSGDEFYIFLRGATREEITAEIGQIEAHFRQAELELPDGSRVKIRVSGGVAWYPQDSRSYQELLRYADFAMYRVKHTTKGQFAEFDLGNYQAESFLLQNKEALNTLVENQEVQYAFQPIVSALDGSVVAYEALMRPVSPAFRNPLDVLAVARSQSKLYEIERLTWFSALEEFSSQSPPEDEIMLFLNSIPNQMLAKEDITSIEKRYGRYLDRLVVELTEEEKPDDNLNQKKWVVIRQWGAEVALDDYGAGYNGETTLLAVSPNYLKIDRMLISGCDQDESRRQLLGNIVSYAQSHGIRVIAEGVENAREMEVVIRCGARYLQGYYLGRPASQLSRIDPDIVRQIQEMQRDGLS